MSHLKSNLQSTAGAHIAECYSSDAIYAPGTIVMIGGTQEITQATVEHSDKIVGVVSTEPAYLLNSMTENCTPVALAGRATCRVIGPITKGDLITISTTPGVGCVQSKADTRSTIGRALADYPDTVEGTVEIKVDRA